MPRGGKRPGAGRPKTLREPSERISLPASMVEDVRKFVAAKAYRLPVYLGSVQAGLAAAPDDAVDGYMDLNQQLAPNPASTFLVRAAGHSMVDANIRDGDLLVVDRSLRPSNGKIVIAAIEGQLTVKFLIVKQGKPFLMPANADFPPIPINEDDGITIWGVVTSSVRTH